MNKKMRALSDQELLNVSGGAAPAPSNAPTGAADAMMGPANLSPRVWLRLGLVARAAFLAACEKNFETLHHGLHNPWLEAGKTFYANLAEVVLPSPAAAAK